MTTNSFIQNLEFFEKEDDFIAFVLYHIKHLCHYVIKHPKPTFLHNSHIYVNDLLRYFNNALLHPKNKEPVERVLYLYTKINKLSTTLPFKKGFTRNLVNEFLNNVRSAKNIPTWKINNILLGAGVEFDNLKSTYIPTSLSMNQIRKKRDSIPFSLVRTHLTWFVDKSTSKTRKFINWFFSIVNKYKFKKELNHCGYFKNSTHGFFEKDEIKAAIYTAKEDELQQVHLAVESPRFSFTPSTTSTEAANSDNENSNASSTDNSEEFDEIDLRDDSPSDQGLSPF